MMKKKATSLTIKRETLRSLLNVQLIKVVGAKEVTKILNGCIETGLLPPGGGAATGA
jgi:hypothetical protein